MTSNDEAHNNEGEFLWLVSLSDLMMLLFVFFVVLFSFSYQKLSPKDFKKMNAVIKGEEVENSLDKIQKKLLKWVISKNLLKDIDILQKEDSLIIQIKEKILFQSGDSHLKESSHEIVKLIGSALTKIPAPYRIGIEGHTDNNQILIENFDGNWSLSSQRTLSVLRALKLKEETLQRVVLMAYGSQKPLLPNINKKGRPNIKNQAKNRRVTIRVF